MEKNGDRFGVDMGIFLRPGSLRGLLIQATGRFFFKRATVHRLYILVLQTMQHNIMRSFPIELGFTSQFPMRSLNGAVYTGDFCSSSAAGNFWRFSLTGGFKAILM